MDPAAAFKQHVPLINLKYGGADDHLIEIANMS